MILNRKEKSKSNHGHQMTLLCSKTIVPILVSALLKEIDPASNDQFAALLIDALILCR